MALTAESLEARIQKLENELFWHESKTEALAHNYCPRGQWLFASKAKQYRARSTKGCEMRVRLERLKSQLKELQNDRRTHR